MTGTAREPYSPPIEFPPYIQRAFESHINEIASKERKAWERYDHRIDPSKLFFAEQIVKGDWNSVSRDYFAFESQTFAFPPVATIWMIKTNKDESYKIQRVSKTEKEQVEITFYDLNVDTPQGENVKRVKVKTFGGPEIGINYSSKAGTLVYFSGNVSLEAPGYIGSMYQGTTLEKIKEQPVNLNVEDGKVSFEYEEETNSVRVTLLGWEGAVRKILKIPVVPRSNKNIMQDLIPNQVFLEDPYNADFTDDRSWIYANLLEVVGIEEDPFLPDVSSNS